MEILCISTWHLHLRKRSKSDTSAACTGPQLSCDQSWRRLNHTSNKLHANRHLLRKTKQRSSPDLPASLGTKEKPFPLRRQVSRCVVSFESTLGWRVERLGRWVQITKPRRAAITSSIWKLKVWRHSMSYLRVHCSSTRSFSVHTAGTKRVWQPLDAVLLVTTTTVVRVFWGQSPDHWETKNTRPTRGLYQGCETGIFSLSLVSRKHECKCGLEIIIDWRF